MTPQLANVQSWQAAQQQQQQQQQQQTPLVIAGVQALSRS
jgi:hypothetical protein